MKFLILISVIFTLQAAAAPYEQWPCASQLKQQALEWKADSVWDKHFLGGQADHFFAAKTSSIGEWVLLRKSSKGVAIARASQEGRLEVSFEGKACEKKIIPYAGEVPSAQFFTDKDLKNYILKNKTGVIYVWSPQMGLSQRGISEIQKASRDKKLPVLVLMSKDISEADYEKLRSKLGDKVTKRVDSLEFKMRNVDQHYPAVLVYKNGQIVSGVKYGYEKADGYRRDIDQSLLK